MNGFKLFVAGLFGLLVLDDVEAVDPQFAAKTDAAELSAVRHESTAAFHDGIAQRHLGLATTHRTIGKRQKDAVTRIRKVKGG